MLCVVAVLCCCKADMWEG
uniref:Uncharacterized protein n=1 Tax=Anguilla anguilla TaxID=7936 RepID=A0A0E9QDL5_ANGAN